MDDKNSDLNSEKAVNASEASGERSKIKFDIPTFDRELHQTDSEDTVVGEEQEVSADEERLVKRRFASKRSRINSTDAVKETETEYSGLELLVRQSIIIYIFTTVIGWIYGKFRQSFIFRLLTSSELGSESLSNSGFNKALSSSVTANGAYRLKYSVRHAYSESRVLDKAAGFGSAVLRLPVRCYGAFFIAVGLGSAALYYANLYLFKSFDIPPSQLLIGILLFAVGMIFIPFKRTLAGYIRASYILRVCIYGFFGVTQNAADEELRPASASAAALLGLGVAAFSLLFPISDILIAILVFAYSAVVIKSPEAGVVGLILLLPIADIEYIVLAVLLVLVSFTFKLLCGRRTLTLRFSDMFYALFLLCMLFGEIFSSGSWSGFGIKTLICLVFIIVVTVVRTSAWVRRCSVALAVDCAYVALYCVLEKISGNPLGLQINSYLYSDLGSGTDSVLKNSGVAAFWLAMLLLPCIAQFFSYKKNGDRFALLAVILLSCYVIAMSMRGVAWIAIVLAVCVFILLFWRRFWWCIGAGVLLLQFIPIFGAPKFTELIAPIKAEIIARAPLWYESARLFWRSDLSGIGARPDAFASTYSGSGAYTDARSSLLGLALSLGVVGLLIFGAFLGSFFQRCFSYGRGCSNKRTPTRIQVYAGMCAVIFALFTGIFENVCFNFRTAILFWLVMGLTVATERVGRVEELRGMENAILIPDIDL